MDGARVVISAGAVFCISAPNGDIDRRTREGFYAHDTRFLSELKVTVEGRPLEPVGEGRFDQSVSSFYGSNRGTRALPAESVSVVRDRYVSHGLHEDIHVVNHSRQRRTLQLTITFDADFADIFQVRLGHVRKTGRLKAEVNAAGSLVLTYRRGSFVRATHITCTAAEGGPEWRAKTAVFHLDLLPKASWRACVTVLPVVDRVPPAGMPCVETILGTPFGAYKAGEPRPIHVLHPGASERPLEALPQLRSNHRGIIQAYEQAVADLRALRIPHQSGHYILAAGLPWFMAVFGRDSIISAIQTKLLDPDLMVGTLEVLASLQAKRRDRFREAEPGKILHEVRAGELSVLEDVPHSCYYGTVDATPLFLRLLWEAVHALQDRSLLERMLPVAEAALRWIDRYGDRDGDGFVEYERRTRHGLRNQGWKDSGDSISFEDGRLAQGPIALAEVQGYVYDAKRKMAELYRLVGRPRTARRLEREAEELRERFEAAFWMPHKRFYALALDGQKQQVDSITSNPGHCLWSGIVSPERARFVVERLMAPDMFSGWGIRTLSTDMVRYHPLSYHNGSVWPHDNAIIAAGMAAYGFAEEAARVAMAMVDAAVVFPSHRVPELFAGYPRREYSFPVPYPEANAPQAWASGAIIYLVEILLALERTGALPAADGGTKLHLSLESARTAPLPEG